MITQLYGDNVELLSVLNTEIYSADLVYGDCIYDDRYIAWVDYSFKILKENGILIVQTDWHTNYMYRDYLENHLDMVFVNHLVWKNEWGNHPKDRFHQCYDDILIFCKGNDWKFYPERIQIPKATANTKLNPSGRMTKTATAWIDDITLTTTAKERVKSNGKNIRWQKPLRLYDRIISPFTDEADLVIDPFMGSGSLAKWCMKNNREYIGIENDEEVYKISVENLNS